MYHNVVTGMVMHEDGTTEAIKAPLVINEFRLHPDSLRDFFAGMAMQEILNTAREFEVPGGLGRFVADRSYEMADAMMEARKPKGTSDGT